MSFPRIPGVVLALGVILAASAFFRWLDPPPAVGDALLKQHAEKYELRGQKIVDKEIGAAVGTKRVPALFIYLLQDRTDARKFLVSVSQSWGYSVGPIQIGGSALGAPAQMSGKGRYWGDSISSRENAPDQAYEQEIVVAKPDEGLIQVTVSYFWIYRGSGVGASGFASLSDSTTAVFDLKASGSSR